MPQAPEVESAPAPLLPIAPALRSEAAAVAPAIPPQFEATPPSENAPPERRPAPHPAPKPLLPPAPLDRLSETLTVAMAAPPAVAAQTRVAEPKQDEVAAAEITIHIGQLDIRAEAPKPASSRRRSTQRRSLPALSDYLRGGRS
jgi:hypothetical protein